MRIFQGRGQYFLRIDKPASESWLPARHRITRVAKNPVEDDGNLFRAETLFQLVSTMMREPQSGDAGHSCDRKRGTASTSNRKLRRPIYACTPDRLAWSSDI